MTDIAIMSEMSLREQFEKETGYKLPDVRDYNSFELNVKLADYYERFSGWMKSKCEELQKENTKLKGKYNHLENHANERVHDLHQQLTALKKTIEDKDEKEQSCLNNSVKTMRKNNMDCTGVAT